MKWLKAALLIAFLRVGFSFDYDATPMEDPLRPIWDRLESLSDDILKGFQNQMGVFLQSTQESIEAKFQELKAGMDREASSSRSRPSDSLVNDITNAVTAWIENFYQSTIRKENDAAILKAEGNLRVRIEALERKLLEHINLKFASLSPGGGPGNSTSGGAAVVPAGSQLAEMESKITNHITTKLTDIENSVSQQLSSLASSITSSTSTLTSINNHVTKITEELSDTAFGAASLPSLSGGGASAGSDSCSALVSKVTLLMNGSQLSTDYLEQQEMRWREMQSVIADVRDTPSFLPRDCSDIHWLHHEARSGVYQIYPSLDRKSSINAWCDMAENGDKDNGGWTIILRRRETDFGHVDFNRTWKDYARGFGEPGEGEWFFPLTALHALTYRQPYSVRILMTDIEDGTFQADYTTFRVEDEANKFRLIVDGFSGNVTLDAFKSKHHGRPFSTPDQDNDGWPDGSCAISNSGGWWFDKCHYTTLTAPFPTSADREDKTIRWMNGDKWLVLNDVTMKIRPVGYGERFDAHGYQGGE